MRAVGLSHLVSLAQAAQQQRDVRGNDAVLHMFACMLQSYGKHEGERKIQRYTCMNTLEGKGFKGGGGGWPKNAEYKCSLERGFCFSCQTYWGSLSLAGS